MLKIVDNIGYNNISVYENFKNVFQMDIDKTKFFYDITPYDRVVEYKKLRKLIMVYSHRVAVKTKKIYVPIFYISRGNRYYLLINYPKTMYSTELSMRQELYEMYNSVYSDTGLHYLVDIALVFGAIHHYNVLGIYKDITSEIGDILRENIDKSIEEKVDIITNKLIVKFLDSPSSSLLYSNIQYCVDNCHIVNDRILNVKSRLSMPYDLGLDKSFKIELLKWFKTLKL